MRFHETDKMLRADGWKDINIAVAKRIMKQTGI